MNDWFPLKNSLKRGAKKLASQEIRVRKHITPTIFPDLISILHVVPWLFFQEYLLTYVKNSPILDFLIICKPTIKWILNVFGIPVYIRVANVVADHNDLLTQWRPTKMSKFRANIFLIRTISNYLWASEVFRNQSF